MKHLTFWFDVISPYAYLAFERLPQALEGLPAVIDYRPLLFAGLLNQWGQKGPAEIEPKRAWTFRHVAWLAHRYGVTLQTPAQHPFNPLALLRLATACAPTGGTPGRSVCEAVFRHVWRGGGDGGLVTMVRTPQDAANGTAGLEVPGQVYPASVGPHVEVGDSPAPAGESGASAVVQEVPTEGVAPAPDGLRSGAEPEVTGELPATAR